MSRASRALRKLHRLVIFSVAGSLPGLHACQGRRRSSLTAPCGYRLGLSAAKACNPVGAASRLAGPLCTLLALHTARLPPGRMAVNLVTFLDLVFSSACQTFS